MTTTPDTPTQDRQPTRTDVRPCPCCDAAAFVSGLGCQVCDYLVNELADGRELLRVDTDGGNYTVIQEAAGNMRFLRNGEPWPAADEGFKGVGLILTLAQDLAGAREHISELEGTLNAEMRGCRPSRALSTNEFMVACNGLDCRGPHITTGASLAVPASECRCHQARLREKAGPA